MWNQPHPKVGVPNIALREEEHAKLLEAQKLPGTSLTGVAPLEVTTNKGERLEMPLAYMPLKVVLKGKPMPAINALEHLKTLRDADTALLDGIIARIKEQRGGKSSYLYDAVPQKQENPVPYLELSKEDAEALDSMATQAGWPRVVSHPASIEGGHSRRLPTVAADKHGRQVRVGKLLTALKKQFPDQTPFLARIEKDLSLLPRITEWELVVSAEPSDILTMSTGRGWKSCVTEGEVNFSSLDYAVSTRDMVAYAVAPNQPNWIARVWLRSDGKGKWWPETKVYTTLGIPNQALLDAVNEYLASKGILGRQGDYHPLAKGWSDLVGRIKQNKRVEMAQELGAYHAVPEKPERSLRHIPKAEPYRRYEVVESGMNAEEFTAFLEDLAGSDFDILGQRAKGPEHFVFDLRLPIGVAEALEGTEGVLSVLEKGMVPDMVTVVVTMDPLEPALLAVMAEHLMDPDIAKVTTMEAFMRLPEATRENILDEKAAEAKAKMPWAAFERRGLELVAKLPKNSLRELQALFPGRTILPKKAGWDKPLSKRAETEDDRELTFLYQMVAEALREVGGYEALEYQWQRNMFDEVADALWNKDLPRASRMVDKILKHVVGSKAVLSGQTLKMKSTGFFWDNRPPLSGRVKPAARMDGKTPGAPPG
jgi:hypothetical protein